MRHIRASVVVSVIVVLAVLMATDAISGEAVQGPKGPEPGTLFLYPERIALQDGGFFNAERGTPRNCPMSSRCLRPNGPCPFLKRRRSENPMQ